MSRYVNEGAVWSAVKRIPHITIQTRQAILEALRKVPTDKVVEVVRCKDCQYFRPYEEVEDFDGECIAHEIETDKTEFCSIGCKTKGKSLQEVLNEIY